MCLRVPAGLKKSDVSFSLSESENDALSNSDESGSKSERILGRGREISMTQLEVNIGLFGPVYAIFLDGSHHRDLEPS